MKELFLYVQKSLKSLSLKAVYSVLLMMYAYQSENTPAWAKRVIFGALAYFILPLDSIPDLTPFIGFTDDLSVISFALVSIACYIDEDVRDKAKAKLHSLIKNIHVNELKSIDKSI